MQDNIINEIENPNDEGMPAADVIRSKLDALYASEPSAKEEMAEIKAHRSHLSRHQRYMQQLSTSARSLAEIQTAWHQYYDALPDSSKHEVWQEFYKEHRTSRNKMREARGIDGSEGGEIPRANNQTQALHHPHIAHHASVQHKPQTHKEEPPSNNMREELVHRARRRSARKGHHAKALIFGFGMGALVIFILLFSFFNEKFITPFIQPSHNTSATPIITDPTFSGAIGPEPKIIIPKINLEAPVVYDEPTIDDKAVQRALERGVLHYPTTPNPGEQGNAVIFGHSSSNILNRGKYKFAFLLLKSLDKDDTFIVQKDGKRYVYKVYDKRVVPPGDLSVLGPNDRKATMTLITCDPPGSSTNRLIVVGEQIFPSPDANTASTAKVTNQKPKQLASNSPSLWSRIWNWL